MKRLLFSTLITILTGLFLSGCRGVLAQKNLDNTSVTETCHVTEPMWIKPPEDAAVPDKPQPGYYFVNQDRSIWAAAWWHGLEENYLRAGDEGLKTGWFRPAGTELVITGQRIDGPAPPLEAHAPCCYPTRFQATGLMFPVEGCWEVTATAGEHHLRFVMLVSPQDKNWVVPTY